MSKATGWAVVTNDEIDVATVSPTRIGAIVNWLTVKTKVFIYYDVTDEQIEAVWNSYSRIHGRDAVPVTIERKSQ